MKSHNDRLKNELLNRGLLKANQIQKVSQEVSAHKFSVREAVLKLDLLEEAEILAVEADIANVAFLDLDKYLFINEKVIQMVPESVARAHHIIPVFKINRLTLATSDVSNLLALDEVREAVGEDIDIVLSPRSMIDRAIEQYYGGIKKESPGIASRKAWERESYQIEKEPNISVPDNIPEETDTMSVIKKVNSMILQAVQEKASDIHIEPEEDFVRVRNRVDGIMHESLVLEREMHAAIVSRIKIMSKLDIAETRKPQDGKISLNIESQELDIRVSTFPTTHGENVVLRILEQSKVILGLADLGIESEMIKQIEPMIRKPYGMVLVTGPTGAGKTTTLYAALNTINSMEKNIITIEDPVEYHLPIIRQTQVNVKAGLTFATGLRNILRQDPDVVLVGEIRDAETVNIAIEAALTGHLVFSTIHTNDAAGTVARLLDMQIEPFLISSSLIGVLAQRLIRSICVKCKEEYVVEPEILKTLGVKTEQTKFFRGKGCKECKRTGYSKRVGIFEFLSIDEELRRVILIKGSSKDIKATAMKRGMISMRMDGIRKAEKGITSLEEVLKATLEED